MTTGYYKCRLFSSLFGRARSRLSQIIDTSRKAKQLYQTIRRSGSNRALWVLNYIEGVLGGHESSECKRPVDRSRRPLPWYTYPAIEYLQQFDFSKCAIFEYGSGNSSKYWSQRAQTVISVESDPNWYESGIQDLSSNQKLLLMTEKTEYVDALHLNDCYFDAIVIDGVHRFNCAIEAVKRIRSGGLILLDNSDWFPNTAKFLRGAGFNQVDFIGAGPINSYAWCTSLFFQEQLAVPRRYDQEVVEVQGGLVQVAEEDRLV